MKKYKAIFGNPPYSVKNEAIRGIKSKVAIWHLFAESSMEVADEVYYITPYLWNKRMMKWMEYADEKIGKVDLNISDHFDIRSSICYWHTHKKDKLTIYSKDGNQIEIDNMRDIKYIPFDIDNTLSIHRKGWAKKPIKMLRIGSLVADKESAKLQREKTEEFKYPVFSTSVGNLYYTNEVGKNIYGDELLKTPKIMLGRTRDNTPLYDRDGEYASTAMAFVIFDTLDNLDIRYRQLHSKFYRFWFATGRSERGGFYDSFLYNDAFNLFPDIPLTMTEDDEIYKWLGLNDDEIKVVEKYARLKVNGNDRKMEFLDV